MNELQLEGADVYMSTFAQLKSYPFFQNPHNWFYPFDMQHSSIIREFGLKPTGENAVLSLILQSGFFATATSIHYALPWHIYRKRSVI